MKHDLDHVFDFIVGYKMSHDGNSPSIREVGEPCGISSTSMVKIAILKLVGDGRLTETSSPHRSRCIEVVGGVWMPP